MKQRNKFRGWVKNQCCNVSETIILFVFLFLCSCEFKPPNSKDNQPLKTLEVDHYLEKNKLQFEKLGVKVHIGKSVKANDKVILSYELDVTNGYHNSIVISKIEVIDYENHKTLTTFDSTYLKYHFLRPGVRRFDEVMEMKTSAFGIANLWLELDQSEIPNHIFHRISFKLNGGQGENQQESVDVALVQFPEHTNLKIGLPFRGGRWFYIANAHRDARLITEGNPTFPQRYAIDWVALTDQSTFKMDSSNTLEAFKTYNQDILAVSDARVVFVKEDIPDNNPYEDHLAVQITRETVGGNHIVLDLGEGIYAFYGHLVPGSVIPKVGDFVKKGQVIGQIGNSGHSYAPHLHFHLETKSKFPLGGEGIPYTFDHFKQLVSYDDSETDSVLSMPRATLKMDQEPINRTNQLPVGNGIVEF